MSESSEHFSHDITRTLRDHAMTFPETSEGASCVNRAFKVRKRNFAFVGEKGAMCRVMVKLGPSLTDAESLAASDARFAVGKTGWVTLNFDASESPDAGLLRDWITESFRMLAPKTLVRQLDA